MTPFRIQTLSSNQSLSKYQSRLGALDFDPVTVIATIGTIIPSLFPNLTGSELLTSSHLNSLFPSNGYWTNAYKQFLLQRIRYAKDLQRDLHMYTGQFIEAHLNEICPGLGGTDCWKNFYALLQKESVTGGTQPIGNVLGVGIDLQTLLLVGVGVFALVAITKKKRSRKRK